MIPADATPPSSIPEPDATCAAPGDEAPERNVASLPTVSVCMPVSRPPDAVRRALTSVLAQDLADLEVVIGDETGTAASVVTDIADPRIVYHHNPRRLGFSGNHRAILDRARGRYLAVFHDDDEWEPTYLSSMSAVLDADPEVGMVCCGTVVDKKDGPTPWPIPIAPGRHDDVLDTLLYEEWFLLPISTMWRRDTWTGPARQWPDLCCGDLQFFLSVAEAGWALYYLPEVLSHWVQHTGQTGAQRGSDLGLGVADDVLAFWDEWLATRPPDKTVLVNGQRARWHLRRARALLLLGRRAEARLSLRRAVATARNAGDRAVALPGLRRLSLASRLPYPVIRAGVQAKRFATERR
jgi:hypothetical protein